MRYVFFESLHSVPSVFSLYYFCFIMMSQALSPVSERRLKTLAIMHGSQKIYQLTGPVVGIRDLDLTLSKGELVAVVSEMDTRGDRRRWLVDAGGKVVTEVIMFCFIVLIRLNIIV